MKVMRKADTTETVKIAIDKQDTQMEAIWELDFNDGWYMYNAIFSRKGRVTLQG